MIAKRDIYCFIIIIIIHTYVSPWGTLRQSAKQILDILYLLPLNLCKSQMQMQSQFV